MASEHLANPAIGCLSEMHRFLTIIEVLATIGVAKLLAFAAMNPKMLLEVAARHRHLELVFTMLPACQVLIAMNCTMTACFFTACKLSANLSAANLGHDGDISIDLVSAGLGWVVSFAIAREPVFVPNNIDWHVDSAWLAWLSTRWQMAAEHNAAKQACLRVIRCTGKWLPISCKSSCKSRPKSPDAQCKRFHANSARSFLAQRCSHAAKPLGMPHDDTKQKQNACIANKRTHAQ
jgi:hypothetical protein